MTAVINTTNTDMTTTTNAKTDTMNSDARSAERARRPRDGSPGLARLLVAGPVLLATAVVLHPDDTHGAVRTLASIEGGDRARWIAMHLLEPFTWLLIGITLLFALPRLAPGKGRRLAATAGVLAAIGATAIGFIVYSHGEAFVYMTNTHISHATLSPLFDQYEKTGFPLAAIPSLAYRLALVFGGIGLFRARTVPRWAAVLLAVGAVTFAVGDSVPLAASIVLAVGPMLAATIGMYRTVANTGGPALPGAVR